MRPQNRHNEPLKKGPFIIAHPGGGTCPWLHSYAFNHVQNPRTWKPNHLKPMSDCEMVGRMLCYIGRNGAYEGCSLQSQTPGAHAVRLHLHDLWLRWNCLSQDKIAAVLSRSQASSFRWRHGVASSYAGSGSVVPPPKKKKNFQPYPTLLQPSNRCRLQEQPGPQS